MIVFLLFALATTVFAAAPTVTAVNPTQVPLNGATLTITGTNFDSATAVKLGDTDLGGVTVVSDTVLTVSAPDRTSDFDSIISQPQVVHVTTSGGASTETDVTVTYTPTWAGDLVTSVATNAHAVTDKDCYAFVVQAGTSPVTLKSFTVGYSQTYSQVSAVVGCRGIVPMSGLPSDQLSWVASKSFTFTGTSGAYATKTIDLTGSLAACSQLAAGQTIALGVYLLNNGFKATMIGSSDITATDSNKLALKGVANYGPSDADPSQYVWSMTSTPLWGQVTGEVSLLPTVSAVSPSSVLAGGTVTVTGNYFHSGVAVRLRDADGEVADHDIAPADVTVNSATELTFAAPAAVAGSVKWVVMVSSISSTTTFREYSLDTSPAVTVALPVPTVTGVDQTQLPLNGGVRIKLTGTHFVSGATTVKLGATAVASGSVEYSSDTVLYVTVPDRTADYYSVVMQPLVVSVTTGGGTSTATDVTVTYYPTLNKQFIESTDAHGQATSAGLYKFGSIVKAGSKAVTIKSVSIKYSPTSVFSLMVGCKTLELPGEWISSSTATVTGAAGAWSTVTIDYSQSALAACSQLAAGQSMHLAFSVMGDTASAMVIPSSDVTVSGDLTLESSYTGMDVLSGRLWMEVSGDMALLPTVSAVSPSSASAGDVVTVTGTLFHSGVAVRLRDRAGVAADVDIAAADVTVNSATELTFAVPTGDALRGPQWVVMVSSVASTTTFGTYALATAPTLTVVLPVPVVTSVDQTQLPLNGGGVRIKITGAHFVNGATTVKLGETAVPDASVEYASDTVLYVTVPDRTADYDSVVMTPLVVSVTTAGGTSTATDVTVTYYPTLTRKFLQSSDAHGQATSSQLYKFGSIVKAGSDALTIKSVSIKYKQTADSVMVGVGCKTQPVPGDWIVSTGVTFTGTSGQWTTMTIDYSQPALAACSQLAAGQSMHLAFSDMGDTTFGMVIPSSDVTAGDLTLVSSYMDGNVLSGRLWMEVSGDIALLPTVSAVSPSSASAGDAVTVTGTLFHSGVGVRLRDRAGVAADVDIAAADVTVTSATELTFAVPTGDALCGPQWVVMVSSVASTTTFGTYALATAPALSVVPPVPVVNDVDNGELRLNGGGDRLVIRGAHFVNGGTTVMLGNDTVPDASVEYYSDTKLYVTVPDRTADYDTIVMVPLIVRVTTAGGTSTATDVTVTYYPVTEGTYITSTSTAPSYENLAEAALILQAGTSPIALYQLYLRYKSVSSASVTVGCRAVDPETHLPTGDLLDSIDVDVAASSGTDAAQTILSLTHLSKCEILLAGQMSALTLSTTNANLQLTRVPASEVTSTAEVSLLGTVLGGALDTTNPLWLKVDGARVVTPTVSAVSPSSAAVSDVVTVTGTLFHTGVGVRLHDRAGVAADVDIAPADVTVKSPTELTFAVPTDNTLVNSHWIVMVSAVGAASMYYGLYPQATAAAVSVVPPVPTVTSVDHSDIYLNGGGPRITITGTHFVSGATTVKLGNYTVPDASVEFASDTTLYVTVPDRTADYDSVVMEPLVVSVTTAGGASTATDVTVTYYPAKKGVFVTTGNQGGGAAGVPYVGFVVQAGPNPFTLESLAIKYTASAAVTATVACRAVDPDTHVPTGDNLSEGSVNLDAAAQFATATITLTGLLDNACLTVEAGARVAVTLTATPGSISFKALGLSSVTSSSDLSLLGVTSDPEAESLENGMAFWVEIQGTAYITPTVTAVTPATIAPGTVVTVTGTHFHSGVGVRLRTSANGAPDIYDIVAADVTVVDATTLTFAVPAAAELLGRHLAVLVSNVAWPNIYGTSSAQPIFFPAPAPTVTGISKATVYQDHSDAPMLTVTGSGFYTPLTLHVGGLADLTDADEDVTIVSPTELSFLTPAAGYSRVMEALPITVTTEGGTSAGTGVTLTFLPMSKATVFDVNPEAGFADLPSCTTATLALTAIVPMTLSSMQLWYKSPAAATVTVTCSAGVGETPLGTATQAAVATTTNKGLTIDLTSLPDACRTMAVGETRALSVDVGSLVLGRVYHGDVVATADFALYIDGVRDPDQALAASVSAVMPTMPQVNAVSPATAAPGDVVTLTGLRFHTGSVVRLVDTENPATTVDVTEGVAVQSQTAMTFVVPASAALRGKTWAVFVSNCYLTSTFAIPASLADSPAVSVPEQPEHSEEPEDHNKALSYGLGFGLGFGIPVLIGALVALWCCIRPHPDKKVKVASDESAVASPAADSIAIEMSPTASSGTPEPAKAAPAEPTVAVPAGPAATTPASEGAVTAAPAPVASPTGSEVPLVAGAPLADHSDHADHPVVAMPLASPTGSDVPLMGGAAPAAEPATPVTPVTPATPDEAVTVATAGLPPPPPADAAPAEPTLAPAAAAEANAAPATSV